MNEKIINRYDTIKTLRKISIDSSDVYDNNVNNININNVK